MKIAIVDLETTERTPKAGLIVEVGVAELDLSNGFKRAIYNKLVCEDSGFGSKHHNAWIFKNSSLEFEDVVNADTLDVVALQKIFDRYPATAFNKAFDFGFLRSRGIKINNELPCLMEVATDICKMPFKNNWRPPFIPEDQKYKWPSVTECREVLFGEKDYIEEHRGCADAMDEADIALELHKLGLLGVEE